jgi:hypothetical protein
VNITKVLSFGVGPEVTQCNALPPSARARAGSNHLQAIKGSKAKKATLVRAAIEDDIKDGYARLLRYLAERDSVAAE